MARVSFSGDTLRRAPDPSRKGDLEFRLVFLDGGEGLFQTR